MQKSHTFLRTWLFDLFCLLNFVGMKSGDIRPAHPSIYHYSRFREDFVEWGRLRIAGTVCKTAYPIFF